MSLIMVREKLSRKNLEALNIGDVPVFTTSDSAFLLREADPERTSEIMSEVVGNIDRPLVGINVSAIISRYGFSHLDEQGARSLLYTGMIVEAIDHLTEVLGLEVVMVPHVFGPGANDDRPVSREIRSKCRNPTRVHLIGADYSAAELKAVIGSTELFIGSRMHSMVASLSMGVPTLAIAYSQKTLGIVGEDMDMADYVLDIRNANAKQLMEMITRLWEDRSQIKASLQERLPEIRRRAELNGHLMKRMMEGKLEIDRR
jgi:polysaccharide pyruvyl transferase WcaK-like protein